MAIRAILVVNRISLHCILNYLTLLAYSETDDPEFINIP